MRPNQMRALGAPVLLAVLAIVFHPSLAAQPLPQDSITKMSLLIAEHVTQARRSDGTYLASLASKEASWHAFQMSSATKGVKVSASAGSFYADRTEENRSALGTTESQRRFSSSIVALTARQPLYRKKDLIAIEQSAAAYQSAEAALKAAEHTLFGRVFMSWIEVLTARDLLQLSQYALEQTTVIREEMERRVQAGEVSIDQLGIEISRFQQRQSEALDASARLQLSERALIELAGPEAAVPIGLSLEAVAPSPLPDLTVQQVAGLVEQQNPELRSARHSEEQARLERDRMLAERHPTVDLYASVSRGENDTVSFIRDESRIGLQLNVPLYTSGAIEASVAQADAQFRRAQANAQALLVKLRNQAIASMTKVSVSLFKIDATRIHVEAASLRAEAVRKGFLAGVKTRGDIARAESEYIQARQRRANEMLEYASAWAELIVTTAQIDPIFLEGTPPAIKLPVRIVASP
jgi:protease secretion system outer membrane protein